MRFLIDARPQHVLPIRIRQLEAVQTERERRARLNYQTVLDRPNAGHVQRIEGERFEFDERIEFDGRRNTDARLHPAGFVELSLRFKLNATANAFYGAERSPVVISS